MMVCKVARRSSNFLDMLSVDVFFFFAMSSVRPVSQTTVDPDEVRRFQSLASKWWDEQGEFSALHAMNDLRVPFIRCVCPQYARQIFIRCAKIVTPTSQGTQRIHWQRR